MLQFEVNYASTGVGVGFTSMQHMGERIRTLRRAKGWTIEQLVERLALRGVTVSISAVSQWERGDTQNIKLPAFLALVQELGTTHEYLVNGPSEPGGRDSGGRFRSPGQRTDNKP